MHRRFLLLLSTMAPLALPVQGQRPLPGLLKSEDAGRTWGPVRPRR